MREFLESPNFVDPQDAPRPYNKELLIEIFDSYTTWDEFETLGKYEEALYIAGIGSGKCLAKGTEIIRYSGEVDVVENIKPGDLLMGNDSTPRKVLSTTSGKEMLYKIIPKKGEPFIVNASHILSLKRTNKGIIARNGRKDHKAGDIVNIPVKDYLDLSKKMKGILKLWRTGIDFPEKEIDIDPYFLGLWLGDGNNHNVGICTKDKEIKDVIYKISKKFNLTVNINENQNKSCPTYIITSGTKKGGPTLEKNQLLKYFKKYNLLDNKHIPYKYLTNSRKNRLALLAGLIDTDGYQYNNCLSFSNTNRQLCNDVLFLCRSLGFAAYIKKRKTKCNGKEFDSYRISISGKLSQIPVRLKRKQCSLRKQKKSVLVTGFRIEPVGIGEYYGFELDRNHLYLLGDFTVTHNSYVSSMAITYVVYRLLCLKNPQKYFRFAKGTKIAFVNISKSYSQAKDVVFGEIKNRIDNSQWFQNFYPPDSRIKSKIRLPKSIFILPLGSNEEAPLGYNIFGAVIDEASFHTMTKDKDYAEESYNQIKKRIRSRFFSKGKMFIITSPRYVYDFAEEKWEKEANNPKVFRRRAALWEAMPEEYYSGETFTLDKYMPNYEKASDIEIPVEYEDEFRQNPERAMRDYGARPSMAIQSFFNDPSIIEANADQKRNHPWNIRTKEFKEWFWNYKSSSDYDSDKRFIHIDLGLNKEGKGDAAGFAMGKFNGWVERKSSRGKIEKRPKILIDFMLRITAKPRDEIKFEDVRKIVYKLQDIGYNIHLVTFDGWQSIDSVQILKSAGFNADFFSVDRNPEAYYTLKAALLDDRLDYYPYQPLLDELQQLEEVKGGKIDHPRQGSKDVADAVAAVCYHSAQGTPGRGFKIVGQKS